MHHVANATPLRLETNHPRYLLEVCSLNGFEVISQPYLFELEVVSHEGELDAQELLFSPAFLSVEEPNSGFHGQIQSIARSTLAPATDDTAAVRYLITLGSRLGGMAYRHNQRIFQDLTAQAIIAQLLSEHGIDDAGYSWQRAHPCTVRDYCAQYRESDLLLLQRLCEQEGMQFYFRHSRDGHFLVFTDDVRQTVALLPVSAERGDVGQPAPPQACEPVVRRIGMQRACVLGELFEEVQPDERGRIRIRFDWSHQGEGARHNDCWIPIDPSLRQGNTKWWGGMEVVVSFTQGDPDRPYIGDRLWDPQINPGPQAEPVQASRRVLTTRIDADQFLDPSQQICIDEDLIVQLAAGSQLHFRVADSEVTIDSRSLTLSGLKIMLSAIGSAEPEDGR